MNFEEIFDDVVSFSDFELACLYRELSFDMDVNKAYDNFEVGDNLVALERLVEIVICARFCSVSGIPVHLSCNGDLLNVGM